MHTVTTIGFDIAKSVFQVHGVDAAGPTASRKPKESLDPWAPSTHDPTATIGLLNRRSATTFPLHSTMITLIPISASHRAISEWRCTRD